MCRILFRGQEFKVNNKGFQFQKLIRYCGMIRGWVELGHDLRVPHGPWWEGWGKITELNSYLSLLEFVLAYELSNRDLKQNIVQREQEKNESINEGAKEKPLEIFKHRNKTKALC